MTGGSLASTVLAGSGDDGLTLSNGAIGGGMDLGGGDDTFSMTGGSIALDVAGGNGDDSLSLGGGSVEGSIGGGSGDDAIAISGTAAIGGSILGEGGDDQVDVAGGTIDTFVDLGAGADRFTMSGGAVQEFVFAGDGNDTMAFSGGTIGGNVGGGAGADQITVFGGTIGGSIITDEDTLPQASDTVNVSGGSIGGQIFTGGGADTVTVSGTARIGFGNTDSASVDLGNGSDVFSMTGGSLASTVLAGSGDDGLALSNGAIGGGMDLGDGDDTFSMTGGSVALDVAGGNGDDSVWLGGGSVEGSIGAGSGDDAVAISGAAAIDGSILGEAGDDQVAVAGGTIGAGIDLGGGVDVLTMTGGAVALDVSGGLGNDDLTITSGTIEGSVSGGEGDDGITVGGTANIVGSVLGDGGDDQVAVQGGTIGGSVVGGAGEDRVTVSAGRIDGGIQAETITLNGGSVGGDLTGLSGNTLVIEAEDLSLRDGVLFQGEGAVGTITGTVLATEGGDENQNFDGFDRLTLDDGSSLRFVDNAQLIGDLFVSNGSTLFVEGDVDLLSPGGGFGNLVVRNATLSMINDDPTDVFNVGNVQLDGATIAIDVNAEDGLSDLIDAAGGFTAAGANSVFVNLVGTPQLALSSVIPIAPVAGETAPGGGDPSPFFTVQGIPSTPGALFSYQVITGSDGGLYLLVSPEDPAAVLLTGVAINSQPINTVTDAVYDILNDAVFSNLGLLVSGNRADAAPSFGIYASGQAARVNHDGFEVSGGGFSGTGPGFTADDFSVAASLEFNAAEYFGLDQAHGLDIGFYGGYTSSSVDLDGTDLFESFGSGDNRGGMVGSYGLYRQGTSYGLVSVTGFFGNTDINNDVLGSTGDYDTAGVAVTGSAGHVYQINDALRFDLRGGLLGVYFQGGEYTDSLGVDFGKSRISFGALKFEPGIFGLYPLENGRVFSPYVRLDLQQRFGYDNTASVQDTEFEFDDADFSAALSGGFNYQISKVTTLSAEVRGKLSKDSDTLAGKIGLKARF
jgi:hypothetical protein